MFDELTTELRNEKTAHLDQMAIMDLLKVMNEEDAQVPQAIKYQLPNVEKAVKLVIQSFQKGGRLIYVGAGTSGRIGILDAVECSPTFSAPPEMVKGMIAGGMEAFTKAVEGAEDDPELGKQDLAGCRLTAKDTVIGIAASGRTPYVVGALIYANEVKANTVSISCNRGAKMSRFANVAIELETGPEVLTGSTRLKAGTAQKMVLNMISTASMVGIGKVYQNLMVDLQPTNAKLVERSKRIIMEATGVDYASASCFFEQSNRHVKTAILMILLRCSREDAEKRLNRANGFVDKALSN